MSSSSSASPPYTQRRYPVYDSAQVGVQFAATLVDTDGREPAELAIHDLAAHAGAQAVELRLIFEDPSGAFHVRAAEAGSTTDSDTANDNDIVWVNSVADRLIDGPPSGRWKVTAEAVWYADAEGSASPAPRIVYQARSPSPAIFYTRKSAMI